LSNAKSQRTA